MKENYCLFRTQQDKKSRGKELIGTLLETAAFLKECTGFQLYLVHQSIFDTEMIHAYMIWDSKEDHSNSLKIPKVSQTNLMARPLLAVDPERGIESNSAAGIGLTSGDGDQVKTRLFQTSRLAAGIKLNRLIILIVGLLLISCTDNKDVPLYELHWDQQQCADPWGTGAGDSNEETEIALIEFFAAKGVDFQAIEFENKSTDNVHCAACSCSTGTRIIITTTAEFIIDLQKLGFTLE